MQAGHHWDVLASYEAANILASTNKSASIYLKETNENSSSFSTAFHDLLTSQLVQNGATVVTKPYPKSITVSYKTQVLEHNDRGYLAPKPGYYTVLASGLWLVSQAATNWSHSGAAVIAPIAIGADLFSGSWASKSPTELLVTTQAHKHNQILMSHSSIYYLSPGDSGNYSEEKPMKVVSQ
jgi:hypothetical protein